MKKRYLLAAVASILLAIGGLAVASDAGSGVKPDEALTRLKEGNERYAANHMSGADHCSSAVRESLAKSQKPFAIILTCSDSRVPPEIVFDQGLGDIFVVRVAGNVADPLVLGSIEYAVEHLGSQLILVLGHERCGAVTASVNSHGNSEGNLGSIVEAISPAAEEAKAEGKEQEPAAVVESAIDKNIQLVSRNLTENSAVLKEMLKEGKIKIATGKYDLDDGKVTIMEGKKGLASSEPETIEKH